MIDQKDTLTRSETQVFRKMLADYRDLMEDAAVSPITGADGKEISPEYAMQALKVIDKLDKSQAVRLAPDTINILEWLSVINLIAISFYLLTGFYTRDVPAWLLFLAMFGVFVCLLAMLTGGWR